MKAKYAILAVFVLSIILTTNSALQAVETRNIDRVRNKGVLENMDLEVIDDFVAEAVTELLETSYFTSIAKIRTVILSRSNSEEDSAEAQYAAHFSEVSHKYISQALSQASDLDPADQRFKVVLNLLILIDGLEDVELSDLAFDFLNDDNDVIRYWATHCLSNNGMVEQLNSSNASNAELAMQIVKQFEGLVGKSSPEVVALITNFAGKITISQGKELLLKIADVRISKYADWSVNYERLDSTILNLLYEKISSNSNKAEFAVRFCQLYSYAMQKYIKDISGGNFLSETQREQISSVLVGIENSCIWRLLGVPQAKIKRAIEQSDYMALLEEHSRLFGDETRPGQLSLKLGFNFKNADGSSRNYPLVLPDKFR